MYGRLTARRAPVELASSLRQEVPTPVPHRNGVSSQLGNGNIFFVLPPTMRTNSGSTQILMHTRLMQAEVAGLLSNVAVWLMQYIVGMLSSVMVSAEADDHVTSSLESGGTTEGMDVTVYPQHDGPGGTMPVPAGLTAIVTVEGVGFDGVTSEANSEN
jgi:hypothetical protein